MSRYWRTAGGVLVREMSRELVVDRSGKPAVKIRAEKVPSGGYHGLLWLRNLTRVKALAVTP